MSLIIEGPTPSRWEQRSKSHPASATDQKSGRRQCVRVALVNNMPDPALEDTELQFFELLDAASGDIPVLLRLHTLTGIPRTDRGQRHLNSFYFGMEDLWNNRFDGVIVTGTEPHQPKLQDEPYWAALVEVFDWAAENTATTVLSCLAAHASVLHSDGVERRRLEDKKFGVFDSTKSCEHPLISGVTGRIRFPHSRWNEVRAADLASCGYSVLTESGEAGVDLFVKKKKNSLFVHFQGHPEYSECTLLKEYRRDIKRFLNGERETYPTMPAGYFDAAATQLLDKFRKSAESGRREDLGTHFPESDVIPNLQNTWRPSAVRVYRNWLQYVIATKKESSLFPVMAQVGSERSNAQTAK